jgi:hypothetical protein
LAASIAAAAWASRGLSSLIAHTAVFTTLGSHH